jgi:uncharacterized protein YceK
MNSTLRASVILVIVALAVGCSSTRQLSSLKEQAAAGNYAGIAAEEVTCTQGERGCNQIRLIKGDACFQVAARGDPGRWDCAIEQLGLGIDMTEGTATEMGSLQPFYENLLEALRQRRDLSRSRAEAAPLTTQLERRAQGFQGAFPAAPAGYYYLASAQLTQALDAADASPDAACRTLNDLQSLLARAPAERGRYTANFQRIEADIRGAKSTVRGCV